MIVVKWVLWKLFWHDERDLALGQNRMSTFSVGITTFQKAFKGHWGYGVLTHSLFLQFSGVTFAMFC